MASVKQRYLKTIFYLFTLLASISQNLKLTKNFPNQIEIPENKIKLSTIVSPLSTLNIDIGASGLICSDQITIFFTIILKDDFENIILQKFKEFSFNAKDELIFLGVKRGNIFFETPIVQKAIIFNSNSYQESANKKFIGKTEVKILVDNLDILSKVEKFLIVNRSLIQSKVILYNFKLESIRNKVAELKKLVELNAKKTVDDYILKNKWILRKTKDYKITVDDKSDVFVYGNTKDRKEFSNQETLKAINVLLEITYEIV